ncbi:hypothetical protein [Nigerium massiliense]|uniref:hypothetical protein n=1 Tax=Nigerium massiliense TaxID=1522317 RepID=UPI0005906510|nr:hypothetical protein [Nigerium massiliense]
MPRRVGLPGASELFRPTSEHARPTSPAPAASEGERAASRPEEKRPAVSGRVKHDEKITVYVSAEELLALEQLRLTLRGQHGLTADRGRIVRAAIAEALADVDERGADSALVRRLAQR